MNWMLTSNCSHFRFFSKEEKFYLSKQFLYIFQRVRSKKFQRESFMHYTKKNTTSNYAYVCFELHVTQNTRALLVWQVQNDISNDLESIKDNFFFKKEQRLSYLYIKMVHKGLHKMMWREKIERKSWLCFKMTNDQVTCSII